MKYDSHKKSALKSIVWRIIGIVWLAFITWIFTKSKVQTTLITFIHHASFLVIFYLHERVWLKSKIAEKFKRVIKALTYEIVLGNLVLGLITYLITGDIKKMTTITLTYILSKLVMYYFYEIVWRRKKIVYAYVVADILNIGHLIHLVKAKKQGDYLIVGVLTKAATMEKKPEPIICLADRAELVASLKCVDEVVFQHRYSPLNNVKKIKPDVLMESTSHKKQPANGFVKSYGGKVVVTPYYKPQSSTKIKNKIIAQSKK